MLDKPRSGVLFVMGVGKTITALTAVEQLIFNYVLVGRVLVVAPMRVATIVWPDELAKWDHVNSLTYTVLHGKDKLERLKTEAKLVDLTLINYEGRQWLSNNDEHLPRYDMIIFDESTYLKNPASGRTKLAHSIARGIKHVIIMTGTFKPNGLENIWSQVFVLDRGQRLGNCITHFRHEYMIQKDKHFWVPKAGAKQQVLDKIKDLVLVVEETKGIGLPPVKDNIIDIVLPPKAMKVYEDLEKNWCVNVTNSDMTEEVLYCNNKQSLTQKLRQATSGFLYMPDEKVAYIHQAKLEALKELADTTGENLLVGVNFKEDVDLIRKYFKYEVPAIYSYTSTKQATEWIREWMEGKLPMLLAHPASLSHGMNMQGGGFNMVWFSLTWDLEHWEQLIARLRRRGSQYGTIFNHILRTKGTIDDVLLQVVTTKGIDQAEAMTYLKEYRKGLRRKYKK